MRNACATLALAALTLRILVPVGLMPSSDSGEWHLSLCPDGLSARAVAALLGHDHQHHGHDAESQGADDFAQCELGSGLGHAAISAHTVCSAPAAPLHAADEWRATALLDAPFTPVYRSRAPPPPLPT